MKAGLSASILTEAFIAIELLHSAGLSGTGHWPILTLYANNIGTNAMRVGDCLPSEITGWRAMHVRGHFR
jgi:hypothetical protein